MRISLKTVKIKNYFLHFKIFKNKTIRDTVRSDSVSLLHSQQS